MFLTRLAVVRPLTVLMGLLGLVIMGGVSYTFLKIDRLPPISIPFVSVSMAYTGATAQDVEQLIVEPIENAVSGMSGVYSITSTSSEGSGSVNVQLVDGTDPTQAALEVERRVNGIRNRLPADASDPRVNKADPSQQPIMEVAITGAKLDQLYEVANDQFVPEIEAIPGVAQINVSGGLQTEVQIKIDYAKLAAYGVTLSQISTALTNANVDAPVGSIQQGQSQLDVRSLGSFQTIDDLSNLIITQTTNGPILLKDLATVGRGYKTQTQFQRLNGTDAVGLQIVKQSDANALQVADSVRVALAKLQNLLPQGSQVIITNDTSVFTRASLDAIQHDLLLSVLLVGGVMLLFLHAWRHTVIVLLAIPTSLISTFLVMYALGFSLNIMSLMALALMIGILVDDSIVVLENIHRHLTLGENPHQAAITGRGEIGMAAIAITMADVVVYTPIAFISGVLGQLFRQYGLTVVAATLFSLLISFTLTPMLASRWLQHTEKAGSRNPLNRFGVWWDEHFEQLGRVVGRTVPWAIKTRWLVLLLCIGLVVGSFAMVPLGLIGSEYAPQEDDNSFSVNMSAPPGTALTSMDAAAKQMEAYLQSLPETQYVFDSVSQGGGFGRGGVRASLDVQVVPKNQRTRSVFEIIDQVRQVGRRIPGFQVSANVASPLGGGGGFGGGGTSSVNVQIAGPDLSTLNQISDQVIATLSTIPGMADVQNSSNAGNPELHIQLDRARMAQLNVTSQSVATALRTAVSGTVVTPYRPAGATQLDITLVANDAQRMDLNSLAAIPVGTGSAAGAAGAAATASTTVTSGTSVTPGIVTLGQIATIGYGTGPVQIQRVDRNRTMTISGTATGRSLGDVASDVNKAMKQITLPAGYSWSIRGGVQQLNNSFATLGQALVLSVVLEYMLLVALYESWFYPIVLILGVPLGIVGSLWGLFLTHNTLNIFSIIGLIMAVGLVAKTGILLVDFTNTLRKRGYSRTEALAEAARVRLRPILMTTATMTFGMTPLALKLEPGAESRAPMAVVVIGGLLTSTFLAIFVTPSLYTLLDDLQSVFFRAPRLVPAEVPSQRVTVPTPAPVPVAAAVAVNGNGHNGHNGNGHAVEPAWLQRLKAGAFEDD
jgi:hydrophobic/amphiphilic exporter-1 (mainly G- bacteria), HAE1 family